MHVAYIGIGSNLGRREKNITAALQSLETTRGIEVTRVSSLYETQPVGGPSGQPLYLNAAAEVHTSLDARRLLDVCRQIEASLGRQRGAQWDSRTIDLDLLAFDDEIHAASDLTVPHPRLHERRFVLEPLAEIAPNWMHPLLNRTAADLLEEVKNSTDSDSRIDS